MKQFNFFEVAHVFDRMRSESFRYGTIGVLDKKEGRAHFIGHINDLPKLIDLEIELKYALFIPFNGYAHEGCCWDLKHYPLDLAERFVQTYFPSFLSLFKSKKYPFSERFLSLFNEKFYNFTSAQLMPFNDGFEGALDVYDFCIKNEVPLMDSDIAYAEFKVAEQKRRLKIQKYQEEVILNAIKRLKEQNPQIDF